MYTGIVEELGRVRARDGHRIVIEARTVVEDLTLGASVSVNGCCLTAVEFGEDWWAADMSEETLARTCLDALAVGDPVNLERPVRLADRLGGHIVQGHVDAVGTIVATPPELQVRIPAELMRSVVEKGSVTVDGVSLTVVTPLEDGFTVALIPHTAAVTTLGHKQPGAPVNIEVDVLAKYVERLVEASR
jgi:riboflavin synthase